MVSPGLCKQPSEDKNICSQMEFQNFSDYFVFCKLKFLMTPAPACKATNRGPVNAPPPLRALNADQQNIALGLRYRPLTSQFRETHQSRSKG